MEKIKLSQLVDKPIDPPFILCDEDWNQIGVVISPGLVERYVYSDQLHTASQIIGILTRKQYDEDAAMAKIQAESDEIKERQESQTAPDHFVDIAKKVDTETAPLHKRRAVRRQRKG